MKKFLFLILSIMLAFTFALSGCSCVPETYLEFDGSKVRDIENETLAVRRIRYKSYEFSIMTYENEELRKIFEELYA